MAKLVGDDLTFSNGIAYIPKNTIALIVIKDENGVLESFAPPSILEVRQMCITYDLDFQKVMDVIAEADETTYAIIFVLPEFREHLATRTR